MPGSRRSAFHPTKREEESQLTADLARGGRWVEPLAPKPAAHGNNHQTPNQKKVDKKPQILDELLTDAGNPLPVGQLREVAAQHGLTIKSTAKADILLELNKKIRSAKKG